MIILYLSALLFAQTPAKPAFEVASIKASPPLAVLFTQGSRVRPGIGITGNRFECAMSLEALIAAAYRIQTYELAGPDWLNSQRFEIEATIPEGTAKDQVPEMLQTLLEERFKLKAHFEDKEQPVYALVAPKDGPKLIDADDVSAFYDGATNVTSRGEIISKRDGDSLVMIDQRTGMVSRSIGGLNAPRRTEILKTSIAAFIDYLTPIMDHRIVDATDLKGFYKMTIEIPREVLLASMQRRAPADLAALVGATPFSGPGASAPSTSRVGADATDPADGLLFHSIEKAGLKLERRKASIKTLIIEHVEKNPTGNEL